MTSTARATSPPGSARRSRTTTGHSSAPRLDPRIDRSRQAVLEATFDLLYTVGAGGLTIDEVARRSGVAKTTIYRHWSSRDHLVLDACSQFADQQVQPNSGSTVADVTTLLTNIARQLRRATWSSVLPSIVDLAEREPEFADIHARIQAGHAAPLRAVLKRGRADGTLPADLDVEAATAALLGALFYRRWFARKPVTDTFVASLVGQVLAPSTAPAQAARSDRGRRRRATSVRAGGS